MAGKYLWAQILDFPKKLDFYELSYSKQFEVGVKFSQFVWERMMVILVDFLQFFCDIFHFLWKTITILKYYKVSIQK